MEHRKAGAHGRLVKDVRPAVGVERAEVRDRPGEWKLVRADHRGAGRERSVVDGAQVAARRDVDQDRPATAGSGLAEVLEQPVEVRRFAALLQCRAPAVRIRGGAGVQPPATPTHRKFHEPRTRQAPKLKVDASLLERLPFGGELPEQRRPDAADAEHVDREPAGGGAVEELPVDPAHRASLVGFGYDHRDVPLGRALGHGPHVDRPPAEDPEHPAGDARALPHAVADHRDDRLIALYDQGPDRSGLDLRPELGVHRLAGRFGDSGLDREADRVLAGRLRDQDRAGATRRQGIEQPRGDSRGTDQVVADEQHEVDVVDRGDAGDRRAAGPLPVPAAVDQGSGVLRVERAADEQGNGFAACRGDRWRVDDPGAEVGELEHLLVAQPRDRQGVFDAPRVGRHHARYIGPDLDPLGVERGADQGRRQVGTAAAQGRRLAFRRAAEEAGDHLQGSVLADAGEVGGDRVHRRFERDLRRLEGTVGPHQRAGIAGLGRQPPGAQRRGQESGRQELAVADDPVDPGFTRPLRGDPGPYTVSELPDQAVAELVDRRAEVGQVGLGGDLGRDLQVMVAKSGGFARRLVASGAVKSVRSERQQTVRDAAQRGHHHRTIRGTALELPFDDARRRPQAAGIGHGGAAELEYLHGRMRWESRRRRRARKAP